MPKRLELIDKKFGRLTVLGFAYVKNSRSYLKCKCDCGSEKNIAEHDLKNGNTKSCGCLKKEGNRKTHGMRYTRAYKSWSGMKSRCLNKNSTNYKYWGGRGITFCEKWIKFENFYADMGKCPKGKSIERKNNNENYYPKNCYWANIKEQNNNKRNNHFLTYKRKTMTVSHWAKFLNINQSTLKNRLLKIEKSSLHKALTTPVRKMKKRHT